MIISRCKIRAVSEHCAHTLHVQHHLSGDDGDDGSPIFISRLPPETAVYAAQAIIINLSGLLNNASVPVQHLASSQLVRHFVDYLETNAGHLVLEAIGKPCLDQSQDRLRLSITPQYASRTPRTCIPHLKLCAIDLRFSWQTKPASTKQQVEEDDPFAAYCPLPYLTMFNDVISRLVTWQLARRYPLIFGPWCKQLAAESSSINSILISINAIIKRSINPAFRKSCRSLFETLSQQASRNIALAADSLREYLPAPPRVNLCSIEEPFSLAMEDIYKRALRRPTFKGISRLARDREEEILENEQDSDIGGLQGDADFSSPLDDIFADSVPTVEEVNGLEANLLAFKLSYAKAVLGEDRFVSLGAGEELLVPNGLAWSTPTAPLSDIEEEGQSFQAAEEGDFPSEDDGYVLNWGSRPCSRRGSLGQLILHDEDPSTTVLDLFQDDNEAESLLFDDGIEDAFDYYEEDFIMDMDHEDDDY